jgi:hypothetical protein
MGGIPNNRFIIIERREKVFIMLSQGLNETEISKHLRVNPSTICRDIKILKKQSQEELKSITKDLLPYEFSRCHTSIEQLIKEGWKIFQDNSGKWTNKDRINALKLVKEAIRTKVEILLQGPTTLYLQQLQDKLKLLDKEIEDKVNGHAPPVDMLLHNDE